MSEEDNEYKRKIILTIIANATIYGNLGLFVGSGMTKAVINYKNKVRALSWKELVGELAVHFKVDLTKDINTEGKSFPEIISEIGFVISTRDSIEYDYAISKLKRFVAAFTGWFPAKERRELFGPLIEKMEPSWIITTNYDLVLECLLGTKGHSLGPDDHLHSPKDLIPIYHLHGVRTDPESLILSQEDYVQLFRPNQYRQQKLSFSLMESVTLMIGYGLGDVNVLTAIDWSKNVYPNKGPSLHSQVIQLLHVKESPRDFPYDDRNGIIIIEYSNLESVLKEIVDIVAERKRIKDDSTEFLVDINAKLADPEDSLVKDFIDNQDARDTLIKVLELNPVECSSGFIELFSKAMDETWKRAEPSGAFYAYNENLKIILDLLEKVDLEKVSPVLLDAVMYNFNRVSFYIGIKLGESKSAFNTWQERKKNLDIRKYYGYALSNRYYDLLKFLEPELTPP